MQIYIKYEPIANFPNIVANVRRYVTLVRKLADGGPPYPVPRVARSGCFSTRGAMQGYDVVLFILAMAKTVIRQLAEVPGGSRDGPYR